MEFSAEKNYDVATVSIVSQSHANLADRKSAGVALPSDCAYGFGFHQDCVVDRTERLEVPEASLVKYYLDQGVFWGAEAEAFVVVGPSLEIQSGFADPAVVGLTVFLGGVARFRDHKQMAGGKEGHRLWSPKLVTRAVVSTSRLTEDGFRRGACSRKDVVASGPEFERFVAREKGVRHLFLICTIGNASYLPVGGASLVV